jgi:hypothetical protein
VGTAEFAAIAVAAAVPAGTVPAGAWGAPSKCEVETRETAVFFIEEIERELTERSEIVLRKMVVERWLQLRGLCE